MDKSYVRYVFKDEANTNMLWLAVLLYIAFTVVCAFTLCNGNSFWVRLIANIVVQILFWIGIYLILSMGSV